MVQRAMRFTPEVLLSAPRRSAGVPNASGTQVLYQTSRYCFSAHAKQTELRVLNVAARQSRELAQLSEISDPAWLTENEFAFLQTEGDGSTSLRVVSLGTPDEADPSPRVAGKIEAAVSNLKAAKLDDVGNEFAIVVTAEALPDGSLHTAEKAKKTTQSTGRLYDSLFARHWDRWETSATNALWYCTLSRNADGNFTSSQIANALRGTNLECPVRPFGGLDNFDLCHSGIVYVAKDPALNPALNTKQNVYVFKPDSWTENGGVTWQCEIPGFDGAKSSPVCSPDGKQAAFLSMQQNGYEADKNHVFVLPSLERASSPTRAFACAGDGGKGTWDRSPSSVCFAADSKTLLVTAEDQGHLRLYGFRADLKNDTRPRPLTATGAVTDVKPLIDGKVFISGSSIIDNSFFAILDPAANSQEQPSGMASIVWSDSNSQHGKKFGLKPEQVSSVWTPASNQKVTKEIHSIIVKPSTFDASTSEKYPVAYLVHGGPQGAWGDSWSTRWNPAVFAEQGYIVIAPNPTGSTGYGQAFTDAIRGNWGGDPYEDIVNCFDWVGQNMPKADNERAVALGASYGGYMMNWIQGHELGRKFKALVCHDGIVSTAGMLATEELYFVFHDLCGTPWRSSAIESTDQQLASTRKQGSLETSPLEDWRKWDPSQHFDHWSTPQLIIHSEKDFRICISDGLSAFNVLQTKGINSQFLTFPDENHWVLKPENSLAWHKVVLNWINKYVGLPPFTRQDPGDKEFWGGEKEEKKGLAEMVSQGRPET